MYHNLHTQIVITAAVRWQAICYVNFTCYTPRATCGIGADKLVRNTDTLIGVMVDWQRMLLSNVA